MPYWDELSYSALPAQIGTFPTVFLQNALYQRTYRSKGGRGQNRNVLVPDSTAEPYSHFDGVNSLKRDAYKKRFGNDGAIRPDRGHTWKMIRFDRSSGPVSWDQLYQGSNFQSPRNVTLFGGAPISFALPQPSDQASNLAAYAQQQFAKAAPTSDRFNLAQFLGELREGLPLLTFLKKSSLRDFERLLYGVRPSQVTRTSRDVAGTAGSNFLGYQFALVPLVNDLRDIGMALYKATSSLTGFSTPIHRRREAAQTFITNVSSGTNPRSLSISSQGYSFIPGLASALKKDFSVTNEGAFSSVPLLGDAFAGATETTKMWYEAEYVLVPKIGFDPSSYLDRLEVLMNTDFTISLLWELAPWSWLVDWLLKIGDSIQANELASSNRLVTNYAYAMCEQVATQTWTLKNVRPETGTGYTYRNVPPSYVSTTHTTVKTRVRANPFGFKPVVSSITQPAQWAILGALAASKGR